MYTIRDREKSFVLILKKIEMNQLLNRPVWVQFLIISIPMISILLFQLIGMLGFENEWMNSNSTTSILSVCYLFLVFGWQYVVGIKYLNVVNKKSTVFRVNGLIPVLLWGILFIVLMRSRIISITDGVPNGGDSTRISMGIGIGIIIVWGLLIQSIVTLFINPIIIGRVHQKLNDEELEDDFQNDQFSSLMNKETLRLKYLKPIKGITRLVVITFFSLVMLIFIADLATLFI